MGVDLSLPDKEKGQTDGTSNSQWNSAVELLTYKTYFETSNAPPVSPSYLALLKFNM